MQRLVGLNPVVRQCRKTVVYGAPVGAVAALFFLLAGSVQGASDERPLQRQEVLAASRIVFCSGHPDFAIEHMRQAVSSWDVGSKSVVPGTSFRNGTDFSDALFVIVEDDSIEPTLSDCIAAYPEPMKNALADVFGMIGQPVPEDWPTSKFSATIDATGASVRGDEWIGEVAVSAFTGEGSRTLMNDDLRPVR